MKREIKKSSRTGAVAPPTGSSNLPISSACRSGWRHGASIGSPFPPQARKWVSAAKPEKPSQRTLDRLALFAGFQDWKDLQKALHGTNDAALNYKD